VLIGLVTFAAGILRGPTTNEESQPEAERRRRRSSPGG
jgi:hypothetical protein